jgi:tRNA threonylcarbamoyladenosine biosynthesis protein TsaE
MQRTYITQDEAATERLAARLADSLRAGDVLALHGDLGAGKTCFIRGLARGLGVDRHVHSPTFTLINEYPGRLRLLHMDLYRIEPGAALDALDLDDYLFGDGVCAIEWAERIAPLLPPGTLHISLQTGASSDERTIDIAAPDDRALPESA